MSSKYFVSVSAFYGLRAELSIGGFYSKGILQHSNNLHSYQLYIWYTLAEKIYKISFVFDWWKF